MRGDRKKRERRETESEDKSCEESEVIDIRNYRTKRIPQLMWRECIKKVRNLRLSGRLIHWCGVSLWSLTRPKCTGEMKIISFIYKRMVIRKILTHLNFYEGKGNQYAPPMPKEVYKELVEVVPYNGGRSLALTWPAFEEKVLEV